MTVSSSVNKVIYSGNSATVLFPVNYYFLENSHLKVILRAADGTETVQALTANYTVTGAGNPAGGSITMLAAPVTGTTLTIVRNVPATQETDYLANDPFPAESHERALDKLTMLTQENEEIVSRSIQIPQTDPVSTNIIVPKVSDRALKLLGFGATGSVAVSNSTIAQVDAAVEDIENLIIGAPQGNAVLVQYNPTGTGAVTTNVQAKLREAVSVRDFGATGDGVTDDTIAIQAALNAIPATGGMLYLPPGTYKTTSTLTLLGKSNVTVFGAGMGASVINASAVTGNLMVLGYTSGAPSPAVLNNVTLRGFTLYGSATSAMDKIVNYRGINNVVFDAMEFYNGYNEGVYCDGASVSFNGLTITNCYFHDCNKSSISNGINTNTLGITDIIIENNRFERMGTGLFVLGQNISICNNQFVDIRNSGIAVGESNLALKRSISGCVISGNNFVGLGKLTSGGFNFTTSEGILTNGSSKVYADGTQDSGIIISNNTFKDSVSDTGHTVIGIKAGGNVKVIGNYASNLTVSNGSSFFMQVVFSTTPQSFVGANTVPVKAYVENNTLETTPGGINWQYGMFVLSVDQASLFCSNNVMEGTIGGAQFFSTTNGFLPLVSLSGDQFSPTCRLYDLLGTDAALGTTSLALTGTNLTTFSTNVSRDVFPNLSTRALVGATPDVTKGLYFFTNNASPVSITDFLDSPDYRGKEITVYFNDANTTVVHNSSKIVLAGAVNFTSSIGSSLTLYQPNVTTGAWYEKSRCKV